MAKLRFYLKEPNKDEDTNIYLLFNYGAFELVNGKKKYTPLKYYTSEAIHPKHWNKDDERVRRSYRQSPEFNTRLQTVEDVVFNTYRTLVNNSVEVTNDVLREELDKVLKPESVKDCSKLEFMQFLQYYMDTSSHTENTTKTYQQTLRDLEEYEKVKKIRLTFDRIDVDFNSNFIHYLKEVRNFSPNTIGLRIKIVKTVMRASFERDLHNNNDYQKKLFSKPNEATEAVYLNDKELDLLFYLDLSKNEKLNNVRDWFLIGAYTGLRFSDLSRLSKDNIKEDTIEITTKKTSESVIIPLHSIVVAILKKYDYQLPRVISNQKFNDYIKDVCKLAGINDSIIVETTKGKFKTSTSTPKHDLISAHTARRSFATNAYNSGMSAIQIMKLTGHRTEKSFLKYIKITKEENAKKLQLHPFFNKMIVKQ